MSTLPRIERQDENGRLYRLTIIRHFWCRLCGSSQREEEASLYFAVAIGGGKRMWSADLCEHHTKEFAKKHGLDLDALGAQVLSQRVTQPVDTR